MSDTSKSNKKKWRRRFINWIGVPLVGGFVISLFMDNRAYTTGDLKDIIDTIIISATFWTVLANGNDIIIRLLDKRWSWLEVPVKRAIYTTIAMLLFTMAASTIIIYVYVDIYLGYDFFEEIDSQEFITLLAAPIIITVFIALFSHGRSFTISWRQAAINVERLKNENLKSRFDSLKNQVNPHFLFNSLNALTTLVYSDPKRAEEFILKLSDVYRYVLEHQEDEVVPLKSEVDFLKSFVFLNKIRFGENLQVNFHNLDSIQADLSVPPVVLQMLVENSLKHNESSKSRALEIDITLEGDQIIVQNNINPLNQPKTDSIGVGLENIISRYEILSSRKVLVAKTESHFKVTVPVLKLES